MSRIWLDSIICQNAIPPHILFYSSSIIIHMHACLGLWKLNKRVYMNYLFTYSIHFSMYVYVYIDQIVGDEFRLANLPQFHDLRIHHYYHRTNKCDIKIQFNSNQWPLMPSLEMVFFLGIYMSYTHYICPDKMSPNTHIHHISISRGFLTQTLTSQTVVTVFFVAVVVVMIVVASADIVVVVVGSYKFYRNLCTISWLYRYMCVACVRVRMG